MNAIKSTSASLLLNVHHQEIQTNLATVKHKVAEVNTALTNLMSEQREVIQQGDSIKNDICAEAQLIINLVK